MDLQQLWSPRGTDEMQRRGILIRRDMRQWLVKHAGAVAAAAGLAQEDLLVEGRDHTGLRSQIPWVRFASRRLSPSATGGWYAVYLFSADGQRVYLSINQGTQIWDGAQFRSQAASHLRARVEWARERLGGLGDLTGWSEEIDLAGTTTKGPAYERGNVVGRVYRRSAVPGDRELLADAVAAAGLLRVLYEEAERDWVPGDAAPEAQMVIEASELAAGRTRRSSAGFRVDAAERRAIEMHAVALARRHYQAMGGIVRYVGHQLPYDLHVTLGAVELSVEVKGTVSEGDQVVLTRAEVAHHEAAYPHNSLFLVSNIELDRSIEPPAATGGRVREIRPWAIDASDLTVISYVYARPPLVEARQEQTPSAWSEGAE